MLLALMTVAHLAASLPMFRPLSSFLNDSSLAAFDYSVLSYQLNAARGFFSSSLRLWGYDPFMLGGSVLTFIWNSNVFVQLAGLLGFWLSSGAVLKLLVLLTAAVVPWLIYLGWRGFGFSRELSLVGALAGVFWFRLTAASIMWSVGMLTGLLVFPISFAGLGLVAAVLRGDRRGRWLLLLAPLALLVHKTAVFSLAGGALIMLVWSWRQLDRKKMLLLGGAALATLVVNLFWIVPLLRYMPLSAFDSTPAYWVNKDPWHFLRDLTDPYSKIGVARRQGFWGDMLFMDLLILGAAAALWRARVHLRRFGYFLILLVLVLFCYGGSFVGFLRPYDPNRYIAYFYLLMTVPAVLALAGKRMRAVVPAVVVLALGVLLSVIPCSSRYLIEHPVVASPSHELKLMADWIENLDARGRVNVETFSSFEKNAEQIPWNEQFGRVSLVLPEYTRAPLLGGQYSGFFTQYNVVNFYSGVWMNRPIDQWTGEELGAAFRQYAITHLLTWSQRADKALSAHPELVERIDAPPPFAGWRVREPNGWFLEGRGRLAEVDYDRLIFDQVEAPEGRAVVSFHWAPTLRCEGAELTPVDVPGDPVPMIGLDNPQRRVVITNGSAW